MAADPRERVDEAGFKLADDRVAEPEALWPDLEPGHRSAVAYQVQFAVTDLFAKSNFRCVEARASATEQSSQKRMILVKSIILASQASTAG